MNELAKILMGIMLVGAIGRMLAQPHTMSFLSDAGGWLFLICAGGIGIVLVGALLFWLNRVWVSFAENRQMQAQYDAAVAENGRQMSLREQEIELERLRIELEYRRQMKVDEVVLVEGRVPVSAELIQRGEIPFETLQLLGLNIDAHRTAAQPRQRKQEQRAQYEPKFDDVIVEDAPSLPEPDNTDDGKLITKQQIVRLDTPLQRNYDGAGIEEGERLTLAQAFQQSTPKSWIVGQNPESGELLRYSPRNDVHLSVLGGTGCGKTSNSAFHLALYALMSGMHLIILDGKDGLDWRAFDKYAEFYEVDWDSIAGYVSGIIEHYEYRMNYLKEHGASNIFELPNNPFQPMFILFEEYGSVAMALKNQDKDTYDNMNLMLDELLRKSRATGIYMTFLDQVPENYSKQMIGNIKLKLVYKLGGMSGNTVAEYYTKKLADRGQFSCSNTFYDAWFVEPDVQKYFKMLYKCSHKLLGGGITSGDTPPGERHHQGLEPKTPVLAEFREKVEGASDSDTTSTPPDTGVDTTSTPITGEPKTEAERRMVFDIYKRIGSKNKAIKKIWGAKNEKRLGWLNDIIGELG